MESENERLSNTEIGELIKENEELAKQCVEWSELDFKKRNKITELKDRIVELEKDLNYAKNIITWDGVTPLHKWEQEIKAKALKQFAERLKEKIQNCSGCYIPDCFESPTNEFAYSEIEVNKAIDETLKEFLNK